MTELEKNPEILFWVHIRVHEAHIKIYMQTCLDKSIMRWQQYQEQENIEEESHVLMGSPLIDLQIQY